jgi:hypothetical protein
VVRIGRWCWRHKRIDLIEEAVLTCLGHQELLIVCLPDTDSFSSSRVHKGAVGMIMSKAIAVTNHRVLIFGLRRG